MKNGSVIMSNHIMEIPRDGIFNGERCIPGKMGSHAACGAGKRELQALVVSS